jgi:hypothetical protein
MITAETRSCAHLSVAPVGSQVVAAQSHDWVVVALLDAAVCQLDDERAVHGTIVRAASLMRKQINSQVAEGNSDERGRLIAWQACEVRDFIDSHITGPVLVADVCALIQLSEARISRAFRRTFEESPHPFVIISRVSQHDQHEHEAVSSFPTGHSQRVSVAQSEE